MNTPLSQTLGSSASNTLQNNQKVQKTNTSIANPSLSLQNTSDTFHPKTSATLSPNDFWATPIVELRVESHKHINYHAMGFDTLQTLFQQEYLKKPGATSTKLCLNTMGFEPEDTTIFSIADSAALTGKTDIVIKSATSKAGLATLLNTPGRVFMTVGSTIRITPPDNEGKNNTELQEMRWKDRQINQTLVTEMMQQAGIPEKERESLLFMLEGKKGGMFTLNPLQALYQGTKGLLKDGGVLLKNDQVITRADLDRYIGQHFNNPAWDKDEKEEKIQEFLRNRHNIDLLQSHLIQDVFPETVQTHSTHRSNHLTVSPSLIGENPRSIMPLSGQKTSSLLGTNSIFYSGDVNPTLINHVSKALIDLDSQHQAEDSKHHLSLYLNSPGGYSDSGQLFEDVVTRLKTPLDIIVAGHACSAAAMDLLPSATGKRFATPHAFFMIHEQNYGGHYVKAAEHGENASYDLEEWLRFIAKKTGRAFEEVNQDAQKNYWLNPVEALFYGSKGMIDAIIVGPNHVITRAHLMPYLIEKFQELENKRFADQQFAQTLEEEKNAKQKPTVHKAKVITENDVLEAIEKRLAGRRSMDGELRAKFNPNDPLENFSRTIREVRERGFSGNTKHLSPYELGVHPEFKHSGANRNAKTITHIPISEKFKDTGEYLLKKGLKIKIS